MFVVNQITPGDQTKPRVDSNAVFDLAFVWESDLTGLPGAASVAGSSILGRFFQPDGDPQSGDVVVAESDAESDPGQPDVSIDNTDDTTVVWEKRQPSTGDSQGIASKVIGSEILDGECTAGDTTLCLDDERFEVTIEFQGFDGTNGDGQTVALTRDTGYSWFFSEDNVEVVLKVLDGCSINDRFWVFAAGLTNVEVNIRVDDVMSGKTATYFNTLGRPFQPVLDTNAIAACDIMRSDSTSPIDVAEEIAGAVDQLNRRLGASASSRTALAAELQCSADDQTLCLTDERFATQIAWQSPAAAGQGGAVEVTDDSGYFWFFDEDNVEVVVKVLDACALNEHFWVFAAGLTNVETTMTVDDSEAGVTNTYRNQQGVPFQPVLDTAAFECP